MDAVTKGRAEVAISQMCEAQKKYFAEADKVMAFLVPLATSIEACDEIIGMLPECPTRFHIFMIRRQLGGK